MESQSVPRPPLSGLGGSGSGSFPPRAESSPSLAPNVGRNLSRGGQSPPPPPSVTVTSSQGGQTPLPPPLLTAAQPAQQLPGTPMASAGSDAGGELSGAEDMEGGAAVGPRAPAGAGSFDNEAAR